MERKEKPSSIFMMKRKKKNVNVRKYHKNESMLNDILTRNNIHTFILNYAIHVHFPLTTFYVFIQTCLRFS